MKSVYQGFVAAVFVILVWGITFVNTKALLREFSALEIQLLRYAIGYLALVLYDVFVLRAPLFALHSRRDELLFALMGLFGVAVYQLLENCAIHYTNASNVSILVCMCPLLTALVSRFLPGVKDRSPLPLLFFVGFVIAMTGVVMVSMNGISEFHFNPFGDLLAALAMCSWVVYSNLVTVMNRKGYSQVLVIRRMFFWTLVVSLPLFLYGLTPSGATAMEGSFAIELSPAANLARFSHVMNYVNLGFLGLLASAACFVLWNRALGLIGTVRCTIGLYFLPAITVLFAYFFLGESLSPVSACGALLILAGVILSGWKKV